MIEVFTSFVVIGIEKLWHRHLGRPCNKVLKEVFPRPGLSTSDVNKVDICESCQYGKSHKLSFPLSDSDASMPLDIVYSDIWRPAHVLSGDGFQYYFSFADDHTRHTLTYPLQTKSEVVFAFLNFKSHVERFFERKLKCLQTN